jgi:hypothetical protein
LTVDQKLGKSSAGISDLFSQFCFAEGVRYLGKKGDMRRNHYSLFTAVVRYPERLERVDC